MDDNYYHKQMEVLADLTEKSAGKQETFFQQILIASASILGILVALHTVPPSSLCIRLVFVSVIGLLALGILSTGITLYDHSLLVERARQAYLSEAENALKDERKLNPVFVRKKRRTLIAEKCSLLFPVLGLIVLVVYAVLVTLAH